MSERKKAYMKLYREQNKERIQAYRKDYDKTHARPSRRKNKDAKCLLCEIPFTSKFAKARGRRVYCTECWKQMRVRILRLLYRRGAQKRLGKPVEPINQISILRGTRIYSGISSDV